MTQVEAHAHVMSNSHLLAQTFAYREAASLEQALAWLAELGPKAKILAGGTDLLVMMKMNREQPEVVINISNIPGLDGIKANTDGSLSIAALASIHEVATHPLIQSRYPGLAEAAQSFGSTQIETMGTIGGNLANGSPAADTAPILLALCAEVVLASTQGRRFLPLEQFFLAPGKTALRPDELLVEVVIPAAQPGSTSIFVKAARVSADLAKASLGVAFTREGDKITACRVAMGSVAPTPVLLPKAAEALIGQSYSPELLARVGKITAESIFPIDDVRSSAWYRRQIASVMLQDAVRMAWERAAQPSPSVFEAPRQPQATAQSPALAAPVSKEGRVEVELKVNGRSSKVWVKPNDLLLNVLREKLELTGTKYACGIGECSACTVLVDGKPMLSCLMLAAAAQGKEITTIEGMQDDQTGALDPVQEAFIGQTAFQCGYCTPGMVLTAKALLGETPKPTEEQVRRYMRGNLCRCTGYASIVRAVLEAAEKQS